MCFSAEASFGVAAVLIPAGAYCLQAAARRKPPWLPLAAVPLILGVQQISEGLVWVGLAQDDPVLTRAASLVYLFLALAFWPVWSPFLVWFQERDPARRPILAALALLGTVWFWAFYYPLVSGPESLLTTTIRHHSIYYQYEELGILRWIPPGASELCYLLMVTVPLFLASGSRGHLPGLLLVASAVTAAAFFQYAFVSVWCFLAAVLAVGLVRMFHKAAARSVPESEQTGHPGHLPKGE